MEALSSIRSLTTCSLPEAHLLAAGWAKRDQTQLVCFFYGSLCKAVLRGLLNIRTCLKLCNWRRSGIHGVMPQATCGGFACGFEWLCASGWVTEMYPRHRPRSLGNATEILVPSCATCNGCCQAAKGRSHESRRSMMPCHGYCVSILHIARTHCSAPYVEESKGQCMELRFSVMPGQSSRGTWTQLLGFVRWLKVARGFVAAARR